jgi:hypothetical protein
MVKIFDLLEIVGNNLKWMYKFELSQIGQRRWVVQLIENEMILYGKSEAIVCVISYWSDRLDPNIEHWLIQPFLTWLPNLANIDNSIFYGFQPFSTNLLHYRSILKKTDLFLMWLVIWVHCIRGLTPYVQTIYISIRFNITMLAR